ncbi:MAG TPA: 16S rRNA (cytosine(1402)-N(4))-methyltransferase RsmH [Aquihabitans sp.]|nr:16S rRNA (cytosine(1402)-N(4))-methyltransferase RsmH [Aquihabitans sp.]
MTEPRPFVHDPVLVGLVVELLATVPAGTVVDATLGGAGHAAAVLQSRPDLRVLGLDRDRSALAAAQARLAPFGDRAEAHHARFDQLATVVAAAGAASQPIVGVLFDLGVSSPQFDDADRGFSYRHEAPLDMRMDRSTGPSAAEVVNGLGEHDLAALLRRNADERFAARIARAIVAARPIVTTTELTAVVVDAIPAPARRRGGHPAKRTFQAIRIHVNGELDVLPPALDAAIDVLAPGGRLLAISYHSGEDRIVKERLRRAEDGGCTCPPGLPCACGAVPEARLLKRGGWTPTPEEIEQNPRAASARLRAAERLTPSPKDQP